MVNGLYHRKMASRTFRESSVVKGEAFTRDVHLDLPFGMYEDDGYELVDFSINWNNPLPTETEDKQVLCWIGCIQAACEELN